MKKHIFTYICTFLFAFNLFGGVSAEESFSVTVDPSWKDWKETNCRMVTDENGTHEECDSNWEDETNITDPDWVISAPLDSEFTFTLNGTNFSSVATYNFSYKILTTYSWTKERDSEGWDYVEEDIKIISSSLIFNVSSSDIFSYNLSGTLSSNFLINETKDQYLSDCVRLYAIVTLERNNNFSIVEYTSAVFYPGQPLKESFRAPSGCSPPPQYADWSVLSLHFVAVLMTISFVSISKTKVIRGRNKDI